MSLQSIPESESFQSGPHVLYNRFLPDEEKTWKHGLTHVQENTQLSFQGALCNERDPQIGVLQSGKKELGQRRGKSP